MPLIRIDVIEGQHSDADLTEVSAAVHRGIVEFFGVPERDQFQIITEHRSGRLVYNTSYLGIERTDRVVMVQVFFSTGRTDDQKKAFKDRQGEKFEGNLNPFGKGKGPGKKKKTDDF